jgi:hypothetical protein
MKLWRVCVVRCAGAEDDNTFYRAEWIPEA